MAEVFGLAASIVGVVGVAGQIAQGCHKASKFWDDFKGAGLIVGRLQKELDLLRQTTLELQSVANELSTSRASTTLDMAIQHCFNSMRPVALLVSNHLGVIDKGSRTSKLFDRAKLAWKQDIIAEWIHEIERSRMTLQSAQLNMILLIQQECTEKCTMISSISHNMEKIAGAQHVLSTQVQDLPQQIAEAMESSMKGYLQALISNQTKPAVDAYANPLADRAKVPNLLYFQPSERNDLAPPPSHRCPALQNSTITKRTKKVNKTWIGLCTIQICISKSQDQCCCETHVQNHTSQVNRYTTTISCDSRSFCRGVQAQVIRYTQWSKSRFNVQLRTYNMVPDGSPIFKACADFDLDGLRSLLSSGTASPFDLCSTYSQTLLDVVFESVLHTAQNPQRAKEKSVRLKRFLDFLIEDCGLDPGEIGTSVLYPNKSNPLSRLKWACEEVEFDGGQPNSSVVRMAVQMASTIIQKSRTDPFGSGNPCLKFMQDGPIHMDGDINNLINQQDIWCIDWSDYSDRKRRGYCIETHQQIVHDPNARNLAAALANMGPNSQYQANTSSRDKGVPPLHSVIALSSNAHRVPSIRKHWDSQFKAAYRARLVLLMQHGADPCHCWAGLSTPRFYKALGTGLENPTQFAERLEMASLWQEALYETGLDHESVIDILDEHVFVGIPELFEGASWKTIQDQRDKFEERLSSGYFWECCQADVEAELLHLERDLGMDGVKTRELIEESRLRFLESSVPGHWPDEP